MASDMAKDNFVPSSCRRWTHSPFSKKGSVWLHGLAKGKLSNSTPKEAFSMHDIILVFDSLSIFISHMWYKQCTL